MPAARIKQTAQNMRRLLESPADESVLRNTDLSPDPTFHPFNPSAHEDETAAAATSPFKLHTTSPFDSSMALTILVLLTALFFMGFFSIYIRRFADHDSADVRRRRNPTHQSSSSPGLYINQKCSGLDPSTVKSLPLVSYGEGANHRISDCPICLAEFEEREIVKLIPHCKHVFHPHCIDTWLKSHVSCPLCRSTQFLKKAGDEELCLDVKEEEDNPRNDQDISRVDGGSTADGTDTWRDLRAVGIRRTSSSRSLCDRMVLQRSMSI